MIRPQSCPVCKKTLQPDRQGENPHFPFCSERCRQIDLYRWSEGKYAIVEPLDPERLQEEFEDFDNGSAS